MELDAPRIETPAAPTVAPSIAYATPRSGPGWRALALLALIAFIAGLAAMAFGLRYYHRDTTAAAPAQPVATHQPVASAPAAPNAPATLDALTARETELSARLAALEARTATVGNDAQAASGNAGRAEALLVTFAARRALDRGQPLGYVEEQLRTRFGPTQPGPVGTVLQAARAPVTLEDLRAALEGVAPLLTTGAASDGWTASLRRELGSLITIRRAATPSALPADRLARARRLLEGGQVEAALAEVARLPGAKSADAWMTAAKRYIGARQALDALEAAAIGGQAAPTHA